MRTGRKLAFMCALVYFVSYLTRHNFAAVLAEIIAAGMTSKMAASVTTVGFISYGVGQLLSGVMGDKLPPEKLILVGLFMTTLMNGFLPFCAGVISMCIIWGINGLAQAMLWPPMVKLLSVLESKEYNRACSNVTVASGIGTIGIYCLVPLILSVSEWKTVFYVCSGAGLIMTIMWAIRIPGILKKIEQKEQREANCIVQRSAFPKHLIPTTIFVMLGIIAQGILRDGVTTWTPVYLNQVYHFEAALSILISVTIPVLSIVGVKLSSKLYNEKLPNEYQCSILLFSLGSICGLVAAIPKLSPAFFALFSALITACMHGINIMLITIFPRRFKESGWISTMAGVLNSCTYVGSTIATSGFEWVSSQYGWNWVVVLWPVISILGLLLCFVAYKNSLSKH